jgi:hypothetical protein
MNDHRLVELINHWRTLAGEARKQGGEDGQPTVLRAHAFGISDGLEIAANDLGKLLEELIDTSDQTR